MDLIQISSMDLSSQKISENNRDNMSTILKRIEDPSETHIMPPPIIRPSKQQIVNKVIKKPISKHVLDEEEYVHTLENIIERDFFPDLAMMNRINEEAKEQMNNNNITLDESKSLSTQYQNLDSFLTHYTSEDNDSFEKVREKDMEERKRKLPWLYELEGRQKQGLLGLYYLGDHVLTEEQRQHMDRILDGDKDTRQIGDDRSGAPDLWKFRVRNQLMFPPDLQDSQNTCLMTRAENEPDIRALPSTIKSTLAIENNNSTNMRRFSGMITGPEKQIVYQNTRLAYIPSNEGDILERPHSPSVYSQADSLDIPNSTLPNNLHQNRVYRQMPMTPLIEPGVNESPFITWGEIAATPLILQSENHLSSQHTVPTVTKSSTYNISQQSPMNSERSLFHIQKPTRRETLARQMDPKKAVVRNSKPTVTSKGSDISRSKLTPAALSLAARIRATNTPSTPFGGDSNLVASYSKRMKLTNTK